MGFTGDLRQTPLEGDVVWGACRRMGRAVFRLWRGLFEWEEMNEIRQTMHNLIGGLKMQHGILRYALDGLEWETFSEVPERFTPIGAEILSHLATEGELLFPFASKAARRLNQERRLYGERRDIRFINEEVVRFNELFMTVRRLIERCEEARTEPLFTRAYADLAKEVKARIGHEADALFPALLKLVE